MRVRFEAARLKSLLRQQLFGLFPELLEVWSRVDRPGLLAVLRLGLTPAQIAAIRKAYYSDNNEDAVVMWVDDIWSPAYTELLSAREAALRLLEEPRPAE